MAIQVAFQELGVFDTSHTKVPLSDREAMPFAIVQAVENVEHSGDMERFVQPMKGVLSSSAQAPLRDVQAELEKALASEIKGRVVVSKAKKAGLIVRLWEISSFESGSSAMRTASVGAIGRPAGVLSAREESMRIEGHTDEVLIHNPHFDSNWELSTARATELVKLYIYRCHMDPVRLSASGFAAFLPVGDHDTFEGRTINRHIDIVILNPILVQKFPFAVTSPAVSSPRLVSPALPAGRRAVAAPQGP